MEGHFKGRARDVQGVAFARIGCEAACARVLCVVNARGARPGTRPVIAPRPMSRPRAARIPRAASDARAGRPQAQATGGRARRADPRRVRAGLGLGRTPAAGPRVRAVPGTECRSACDGHVAWGVCRRAVPAAGCGRSVRRRGSPVDNPSPGAGRVGSCCGVLRAAAARDESRETAAITVRRPRDHADPGETARDGRDHGTMRSRHHVITAPCVDHGTMCRLARVWLPACTGPVRAG